MKTNTDSFKVSIPQTWLRLEHIAALMAAVAAYIHLGGAWWFFALLFLVPDLSMLGYLVNARVGAATYNALHNIAGPLVLGASSLIIPTSDGLLISVIWLAHIAFDRMLGYGLKMPSGFSDTHLGRIGRVLNATR
jgi:Domain of unknown function (DUF4260)